MGNYETCGYRHLSFPDPVVASACHFAPTLSCQTDAAISRSCNYYRRRRDSTGTAENRTLTGNSISNWSWESGLLGRKILASLEAGAGIEPANSGFADRDLTTWLPRRCEQGQYRCSGLYQAPSVERPACAATNASQSSRSTLQCFNASTNPIIVAA